MQPRNYLHTGALMGALLLLAACRLPGQAPDQAHPHASKREQQLLPSSQGNVDGVAAGRSDREAMGGEASALAVEPDDSSCPLDALDKSREVRVFVTGGEMTARADVIGEPSRYEVEVDYAQAPVVLMLFSNDAGDWDIRPTASTRIAAVIATGDLEQRVSGLASQIPVVINTGRNRFPCGGLLSYKRRDLLNRSSQRWFNRPVDVVYPVFNGRVVMDGRPPRGPAEAIVGSRSARASEHAAWPLGNTELQAATSLQEAVERGWLREARASDVGEWNSASARVDPALASRSSSSDALGLYNVYVVLKPFTLPPGLHGANSATFYVPRGVARPRGELGHSTLYDFNTMTCRGVRCGRQ